MAQDWPNVLRIAKRNAESAGVADHYQLLPGDAFTVDLGVNFDCVFLTNFLHHFNKRECERILQRIYECLNPGGRLFILEFVPNPDRVTPPVPASFSLMMLGRFRTGRQETVKAMVTSATFRPLGMIGKADAEEDEGADSLGEGERPFGPAPELDQRKMAFEYLKQLGKRKRLRQKLEREDRMREETRAEMRRVLEEGAERAARESQETAAENAVEDEMGKPVKRRASARRKTSAGRRVPHPITAEDRARIDGTTDRHTRGRYNKTLEAIIEGRLILTKEQYHALTVLGRSKGWNRHPSARR